MTTYEEVFKSYHRAPEFVGFIPLESQGLYGAVALIVGLIFTTLALTVPAKASGLRLVVQFLKYALMSLVGSIFLGLAAVFLSDSFGVYA
ncbi:LADA_0G15698g1_1 [Lachancea dasiensis]|uniref:Dolichyl-diphosphooligosaccharide-protein glycosyltransferase subunit OST5 n=1 Tax=Lachancea dasiensis TaxID=1072105 RepID=A0A1G4JWV8_9SACH|nr:LADA_0G15698g1_1 [Lachancea dasiensis]